MNVRRPLRRPLALLVPLAVCGALLVGCGDDDGDPNEGASDTASETGTPSPDPSESVSDPVETEPTDDVPETDSEELPDGDDGEGGDGRTEVPAEAAELCRSFEEASAAIGALAMQTEGGQLPEGLVEAYHAWGAELGDVELPGSFDDDQREGVQIMARLLAAIPDDADVEDFDRLEEGLSDADQAKVEAVTDYVDDNCGITGS